MTPGDMRSLSRQARHDRRALVVRLRAEGLGYAQIALLSGLSRTGVFDICKRHLAQGQGGLDDAPTGRRTGGGRRLSQDQEAQLRQAIVADAPDALGRSELLWTGVAVSGLIEQRLGIRLPVRTLGLYLDRWGFGPRQDAQALAGTLSPALRRWLADDYPGLAARSKAQDGEIRWAAEHELHGEQPSGQPAPDAPALPLDPGDAPAARISVISSVTNQGQLRWQIFSGPLDAATLIEFLRRLVRGSDRKIFQMMSGLRVHDEDLVLLWLAEHVDAIEAFHLPAAGTA